MKLGQNSLIRVKFILKDKNVKAQLTPTAYLCLPEEVEDGPSDEMRKMTERTESINEMEVLNVIRKNH